MKKISVLIALGMLMIAPWGMAQTIYDGAKLTGKDISVPLKWDELNN